MEAAFGQPNTATTPQLCINDVLLAGSTRSLAGAPRTAAVFQQYHMSTVLNKMKVEGKLDKV